MELIVDPKISKQKFDQELYNFRQLENENIKKGIWILNAEFPDVFIVFSIPQLSPPFVHFGLIINFSNYDFWPPSVSFVNPFSRIPLKRSEINGGILYHLRAPDNSIVENVPPQDFIQSHKDDKPFLCLPGVREYHDHPAHTNDSWLLHRGKGEGTLNFIVDTIYRYGIAPIKTYTTQIQVQINGLTYDPQKIP